MMKYLLTIYTLPLVKFLICRDVIEKIEACYQMISMLTAISPEVTFKSYKTKFKL